MKKVISVFILGTVILSLWVFLKKAATSENFLSRPMMRQKIFNPIISGLTKGAATELPAAVRAPSAAESETIAAEVLTQLQQYQSFQGKVFLSHEEEALRSMWLKDERFLQAVGRSLKNPQLLSEPAQAAGIDLLVEALRFGDPLVAWNVILDILMDSQIENDSLHIEVRKLMAGVKAELLYHATATSTDEHLQKVQRLLPGKVSQKIWQNVQEQQKSNLEESQIEVSRWQASRAL